MRDLNEVFFMNDIPFSVSLSIELNKHVTDYTRELKTVFLLRRTELHPNCSLLVDVIVAFIVLLFSIPCSIFSTVKFITLCTLKVVGMIFSYVIGIIPIIGLLIAWLYSMCYALVECVFNILSIILYIIPVLLTSIGL